MIDFISFAEQTRLAINRTRRGWYGEELYAISDHFLVRECGVLYMNSISITYRHYGNLWLGHIEVLCHPFTHIPTRFLTTSAHMQTTAKSMHTMSVLPEPIEPHNEPHTIVRIPASTHQNRQRSCADSTVLTNASL